MTGVSIIGIGMGPFGRTADFTGQDQGVRAVRLALDDAGVRWDEVGFAAGGSSASGGADALVSRLGMTGVPFVNVSNGCATGGSALMVAAAMIKSGECDIAVAVGFDKHGRGAFSADPELMGLPRWYGDDGLMVTTQFFAMKIQRYMHDFGISTDTLARVASKAFANGSLNENAWRRKALSLAEVSSSPMVNDPLTQYMYCSPGEGGVAVVLCRDDITGRYKGKAIQIAALAKRTRRYGSFEVYSPYLASDRSDGPSMESARACFDAAGVDPKDVDLAQIQDTESGAEIMHMAETGLCEDGEQEAMIADGVTQISGALPINTDGGCLANGEPIGASGLRQVYENVLQLRGDAGNRQVSGGPQIAFTHVYGAPGVSACTLLTI